MGGYDTRQIRLKVPSTADTGVYLEFGGGAATTKHFVEAGDCEYFDSNQAITVIRAGAANVTVYVSTGVNA